MPSSRVFFVLGVATLLAVAAALAPILGWVALGLDLLLLVACGIDLARTRSLRLQAERQWPPMLVQGAPSEISVRLQAQATAAWPGKLLQLRLRETLAPALAGAPLRAEILLQRVVAQNKGARHAGPADRGEIQFAGRWQYTLHPRRRGDVLAGPLMVRVLGPWGLIWHQRQLLPPEPRRVYPQVRWDGKVGHLLFLAHRRSLGHNPLRQVGLGSEPYALREYLPGDALNRIHWKASARHGRLVSREDTWEKGGRLLLLLDCARGMSGLDGQRSKLDHALAAVLALARFASARGDRVTIAAFASRVERSLRLPAGARGGQRAYETFYDLGPRTTEPAYDAAAAWALAAESRRSSVVLFTSVVDLAAAELLRQSLLQLERRHRPVLLNLEDPELLALSGGLPGSVEEAFAKVSALEIQLANRRLGQRLRHAGVRAVSAPADRLALEALEAYLAQVGGRAA